MIVDTLNAYQRSAALKTAIELDVFTEIARGSCCVDALAKTLGASTRGIRILCDFLVSIGLLSKESGKYFLTIDSATFLDRSSMAYFGSMAHFLLDPRLIAPFLNLTEIVRQGRTTSNQGTVKPDNPLWVDFAKHMATTIYPAALEIADLMAGPDAIRVLDVAAGHGLFGIAIAQRNARAHVTALDWSDVLAMAATNAEDFGVADRFETLPGDAFEVDLKGPYDLVLVTNFFHHFDPRTCQKLMEKILDALAPGGRCLTLEYVTNEDRVSPAPSASFALLMLASTVSGDAYTFGEYETMFRNAGFGSSQCHSLTKAPQVLIVSRKK